MRARPPGQGFQASKSPANPTDFRQALNNDLQKDRTVQKTDREAIVREADQLSKDAKALRGRVRDGKPSSAEADRLLSQASKLQAFIEGRQVPTAAGDWARISARLQGLAGAYGAR